MKPRIKDVSYDAPKITVWLFKSVNGHESVRSIRPMRDDDFQYEHEYQRIIYRGPRSGAGKWL